MHVTSNKVFLHKAFNIQMNAIVSPSHLSVAVETSVLCSFCENLLDVLSEYLFVVGSLPRILTHPVDSRFVRGSSGELHCDVKGDPEPSVTWYKDNYPVELGGKVSQLDDNSLFFKRIRKRVNDGIYWCVATNPHGQVNSKKVSLTVTCKLHFDSHYFLFYFVPSFVNQSFIIR